MNAQSVALSMVRGVAKGGVSQTGQLAATGDYLMETGDYLLMETGDKFLLEHDPLIP
jgi:hypothetical protein